MSLEDNLAAELGDDEETTEPEPEPVEPDDDDADESEPEPPPEPDAETRLVEIDKKLEGLRKHVTKRMSEILGDDAPYYIEDPISRWSGVPGWMPPVEIPPDVAAELYHLLGQHAPSDYRSDEHSAACSACNGFGEVATGSKVMGQDRLPCVECSGLGWTPTDDARRPKGLVAPNGLTPASPSSSGETSYVPAQPVEEDPEVQRLRQLGYAVIPPMVVSG